VLIWALIKAIDGVRWIIQKIKEKGIKKKIFIGHEYSVKSVNFSPDSKYIVSGSDDGKIKLWNINGELIRTFEKDGSVYSVNFSPDDKYIVAGGEKSEIECEELCIEYATIKLWNIKGKLIRTFDHKDIVKKEVVESVNFSPDGRYIVSGSLDGKIKLWL